MGDWAVTNVTPGHDGEIKIPIVHGLWFPRLVRRQSPLLKLTVFFQPLPPAHLGHVIKNICLRMFSPQEPGRMRDLL